MNEQTKYNIGIEFLLKSLKRDIESLLCIKLSDRSRKIENIKGKSLFIKILNEKFKLFSGPLIARSIFSDDVLRDFLNIKRCNVYNYLKKFEPMCGYSKTFKGMYNVLYSKYVIQNKNYELYVSKIENWGKELKEINTKFDNLYKLLMI